MDLVRSHFEVEDPAETQCLVDIEELAEQCLPSMTARLLRGPSTAELIRKWDRQAFDHLAIIKYPPSELTVPDTGTTLFGQTITMPVILGESVWHSLVHADCEDAMIQSATMVSLHLVIDQRCAASAVPLKTATHAWFKPSFQTDQVLTLDLVQSAEAAGYRCLYASVEEVSSKLSSLNRQLPYGRGFPAEFPRHGWEDIEWLCSHSRLPIVLSGVSNEQSCEIAVQLGIAGLSIACSNTMNSPALATEGLARTAGFVGGRLPIILEADLRSGLDILKAVALGASGILITRSVLYASALGGVAAVEQLLHRLQNELALSMASTGCASISRVGISVLKAV